MPEVTEESSDTVPPLPPGFTEIDVGKVIVDLRVGPNVVQSERSGFIFDSSWKANRENVWLIV